MCQALGVTRSGYYAWKRRPPSATSKADAQLAVKVTALIVVIEESTAVLESIASYVRRVCAWARNASSD